MEILSAKAALAIWARAAPLYTVPTGCARTPRTGA